MEEDRVGDVWEAPAQGAWPSLKRVVTAVGPGPTLNGKRPGLFQYGDFRAAFVAGVPGGWRNHAKAEELLAMGFVKVARGICPHRQFL